MENLNLDCDKCGVVLVKSYPNEKKLRAKLVKWTKDGMFAVCKSCNAEVLIEADVLKSLQDSFVYEVNS